jgi:hypothetical protein
LNVYFLYLKTLIFFRNSLPCAIQTPFSQERTGFKTTCAAQAFTPLPSAAMLKSPLLEPRIFSANLQALTGQDWRNFDE